MSKAVRIRERLAAGERPSEVARELDCDDAYVRAVQRRAQPRQVGSAGHVRCPRPRKDTGDEAEKHRRHTMVARWGASGAPVTLPRVRFLERPHPWGAEAEAELARGR